MKQSKTQSFLQMSLAVPVLLTATVLAFSGCASEPKKEVALPQSAETVKIDPALLQECKTVPKPATASDKDLLAWIQLWGASARECAQNKSALNKIVKDAFNIK